MIGLDTNILVYAHRVGGAHQKANDAVTELAEGTVPWTIPPSVIAEFIAVVTGGPFVNKTPLSEAIRAIDVLMSSPSYVPIYEREGWYDLFCKLAREFAVVGSSLYDLRIVSQCLVNGVEQFWSADHGLTALRLPIKITNPLA